MSNARTSTAGDPCPQCGQRGAWSSLDASAVYTPPPGHTTRRLEDDLAGITYDSCPQCPTQED